MRGWLEEGRLVTVHDIRTGDDRAQLSGEAVVARDTVFTKGVGHGRAVSARISDLSPWLSEWLMSEDAFVERVVGRVPATPPNFTRIVALNEAGQLPEGDPTDLEACANRYAVS